MWKYYRGHSCCDGAVAMHPSANRTKSIEVAFVRCTSGKAQSFNGKVASFDHFMFFI